MGVLWPQRLNKDYPKKSFQHSDSNYSSRRFEGLDYSKHSQERCYPIYSAIASQYSSSSCSEQSSFEGSMQRICFERPMNAEQKFSYQVFQRSVTAE